MTLQEIKSAVDRGQSVKWANQLYDVIKDSLGQYLIICSSNQYTTGLTHTDGKTLNGRSSEFYISKGKRND
jgi:hypothetical protein